MQSLISLKLNSHCSVARKSWLNGCFTYVHTNKQTHTHMHTQLNKDHLRSPEVIQREFRTGCFYTRRARVFSSYVCSVCWEAQCNHSVYCGIAVCKMHVNRPHCSRAHKHNYSLWCNANRLNCQSVYMQDRINHGLTDPQLLFLYCICMIHIRCSVGNSV